MLSDEMREWTLFYHTTGYSGRILAEEKGHRVEPQDYPCTFSVIERSAYEDLVKEVERLKKERIVYRTLEAIAGDCKEKADLADEIERLSGAIQDGVDNCCKHTADLDFWKAECEKFVIHMNHLAGESECHLCVMGEYPEDYLQHDMDIAREALVSHEQAKKGRE